MNTFFHFSSFVLYSQYTTAGVTNYMFSIAFCLEKRCKGTIFYQTDKTKQGIFYLYPRKCTL